MERLWAPWRIQYIESTKEPVEGCLFDTVWSSNEDRKNLVLHRGGSAFIMMNAYPYSNGHLMVAPVLHSGDIRCLPPDTLLEINQLVGLAISILEATYRPDGFNVGINLGRVAGAGIPSHIHWHIVPRWEGDTNFMMSVGLTRVLPESLEQSYDRLKLSMENL